MMTRIIVLLSIACVINGCTRQATSPNVAQKPPAASQPLRKPTAKRAVQTVTRFTGFSPDGKTFVVGLRHEAPNASITGSMAIWDVIKQKKIAQTTWSSPVFHVGFLQKRSLLLVCDGNVALCDPASGKIVKRLATSVPFDVVAVSPDEKLVALLTRERMDARGRIEIRDVNTWALLRTISIESPRAAYIREIDFAPDNRRLVTGAWDVSDGIEVYDIKSTRRIWAAKGDQEGDVVWTPDGKSVAAVATDGIHLLRARDGRLISKLPADYESPIRFSPDGRRMIFTHNGLLVTYNMYSHKVIGRVRIKNLSSFIISPDARTLAKVSKDGSQVQLRSVSDKSSWPDG